MFIKGSKGIFIFVNEDEERKPAILLNWSKLTFNYPLKNDFKLRVVPKGEPAGKLIFTLSNDEILKGTYDWACANVIVGIGIIIFDKFNEFPRRDLISIYIESLVNYKPSSLVTWANIY